MKRGGSLKRSTPLRSGGVRLNRTPLRVDPAKVRAFAQRGRQTGFRRARPEEGPLSPEEWRRAVFEAAGGRCIMPPHSRARDAYDPAFDAHHVVPKRELRARGLYAWVWDARNALWLSEAAHARQESAHRRVPRELLPASVWAFCWELDQIDGTEWATALVERLHPDRG